MLFAFSSLVSKWKRFLSFSLPPSLFFPFLRPFHILFLHFPNANWSIHTHLCDHASVCPIASEGASRASSHDQPYGCSSWREKERKREKRRTWTTQWERCAKSENKYKYPSRKNGNDVEETVIRKGTRVKTTLFCPLSCSLLPFVPPFFASVESRSRIFCLKKKDVIERRRDSGNLRLDNYRPINSRVSIGIHPAR